MRAMVGELARSARWGVDPMGGRAIPREDGVRFRRSVHLGGDWDEVGKHPIVNNRQTVEDDLSQSFRNRSVQDAADPEDGPLNLGGGSEKGAGRRSRGWWNWSRHGGGWRRLLGRSRRRGWKVNTNSEELLCYTQLWW